MLFLQLRHGLDFSFCPGGGFWPQNADLQIKLSQPVGLFPSRFFLNSLGCKLLNCRKCHGLCIFLGEQETWFHYLTNFCGFLSDLSTFVSFWLSLWGCKKQRPARFFAFSTEQHCGFSGYRMSQKANAGCQMMQ